MPRLHALELLPDDAGCDAVRRDWQALRDAGLPSQLDHRGSTNIPHVTLASAPSLTAEDRERASALLAVLLPVTARTAGVGLLGDERVTIVRLLTLPDEVTRTVLDLRGTLPSVAHLGWLPHLTLARRVERSDVARALAVVSRADTTLTLSALRHWDPEAGVVHTL